MGAFRFIGALLVALLLASVGIAVVRRAQSTDAQVIDRSLQAVSAERTPPYMPGVQDTISASRRNAIVAASQRVAPAVVSVNVIRRETMRPRTMWEQLYFPEGVAREVAGLGSGFIIRDDGLVLTNEHVVEDATEIVVTLADGRDFAADLVGKDEVTDLALLRLRNVQGLPVAPLGSSSNLIIGEWAIAIGNPFGYALSNAEPTVTAGVISGLGRNIVPNREETEGFYLDMIQTDAAINQGNSGGPLVNALGQVIGVNASILSPSGGSIGLGFAIPIDRARRIVADLLEEGRVRRAWVGATVAAAEPNAFGRSRRVQLDSVAPNSPAAKAGLRSGMVLVRVAGRPISTPLDWEARMVDAQIGKPVEVVATVDGREQSFRLVPQDVPPLVPVSALNNEFQLLTITPEIRRERRIVAERGALVIRASDAAKRVGVREGDVIVEINRVPVRTAEEAARIMSRLRGGVRLGIERQGSYGYVSFSLS